jgi:hypothetical protein
MDSKFSEFMKFLEKEETSAELFIKNGNKSHNNQIMTSARKTSYIWEEDEVFITNKNQSNFSNGSSTSRSINKAITNNHNNNLDSNITNAINELQNKLNQLHDDLRKKQYKIREITNQIQELDEKKKKKEEKFIQKWESRLNEVRRQQNERINNEESIFKRLVIETKDLESKRKALLEKESQFEENNKINVDKRKKGN